jgi:Rrf2 family protein
MMKISTRGRYALRIMLDLAQHDTGEFIPIRDISERQEITVKYLEQLIGALSKAGYLKSARGNNGGYRLAKSPRECRAGDILRTMEGSLAVVACLEDAENECPRSGGCTTLPFWQGLNRVIEEYVDSVTLEDMLRDSVERDWGANI